MVVHLDPHSQDSFEQHGPWHFRDIRFKRAEPDERDAGLVKASVIPPLDDQPSEPPSTISDDPPQSSLDAAAERIPVAGPEQPMANWPSDPTPIVSFTTKTSTSGRSSFFSTPGATLTFAQIAPPGEQAFSFSWEDSPTPSTQAIKRRRLGTDVDGPNTASLGCKKRRLLRHLITSRLSEPFSLPATHILNRESVATGDRRFLKLAAIMAARRLNNAGLGQPHQPPQPHASPSSLLRRAAMINRFRLRIRTEAAERGDVQVADLAANAALLQQSHGLGLVVGARFPAAPASALSAPSAPVLRIPYQDHPHPLSRAGSGARSSPPGSPSGLRPTPTTAGGLRLPPSPRVRPLRSPELRSTRPMIELNEVDDLDDDSVAFPTSEHESRYEDEPDDVYADFGVIFGSGDGDSSDDDNAAEHVEDYMDDLDGIPWTARC
ncbi:hypothetical protein QBC46DRAFT_271324 [Diplogelasinospora grovesii]|uniref:Uncharacterized protein n=1 Tax=Diplogelasinospora grovesii TaxID=303347 RepID=A0AAN6MY23_9PEZI|nr:hypothetical protein QBC46DRAFT_271324 [Diplogelasinospora grovesii]